MLIFVVDENPDNNLKFIEFGKPYTNGDRSWGPGVREYYMVHLILEGEGEFNGHQLKAGQYFITQPYQRIVYKPNPENPWNYIWILLKGDGVKDFLSSYGFYSSTGVGEFGGLDQLQNISLTLFAKDYDIVNEQTAYNLAKLLFSYNQTKKQEAPLGVKERHLKKAKDFIESKYHEGIFPSDVAKFVSLDEKYLYSLFKAIEGVSVQEYLNNLRIEKAKILLEKSELNISEIAYSVGIDDPLHFSRFFKNKVGLSPKAYRKTLFDKQ